MNLTQAWVSFCNKWVNLTQAWVGFCKACMNLTEAWVKGMVTCQKNPYKSSTPRVLTSAGSGLAVLQIN